MKVTVCIIIFPHFVGLVTWKVNLNIMLRLVIRSCKKIFSPSVQSGFALFVRIVPIYWQCRSYHVINGCYRLYLHRL